MRLTLRTRLAVWFAASILLILAPILAGLLATQWTAMRQALDHHLEEDLEVALQMLVVRENRVVWRTEADQDVGYDAGPQRWVEVYGPLGETLLLRGLPRRPDIRIAVSNPVREKPGYRTIRTPAGAYVRTLVADRPVGPQRAFIRVARSEDTLREDVQQLILLFALGAPLAVLAAALTGYWVSGRALLPLARMAERARSISADHLSERLPIANSTDELGQLALVFNDTFARLEASFRRLKRFTADASHELRTPLTAIRSVGEVGLREARTPHDYQEIIGSMLEETDRLARVVDTLLTLSRWESGRTQVRAETVDLRVLAHDAASQLSALAEDRSITIEVQSSAPHLVTSDPVMTRQAVTNVLDNAIKFTREGGRITIGFRSAAHEHQLVIDDEGPGIPADERQRVLERFYRVPGTGDGTSGSGLGLAIVQQAMVANGGRVLVEESEAGGTRVVLALPSATSPC